MSEERLQLAVATTGLGIYDWDLATDRIMANASYRAILGIADDVEILGKAIERDVIHPEDLAFGGALVAAAFDPATGGSFEFEHRVNTPAGVRWLLNIGLVSFTGEGTDRLAVRVNGNILDITRRKELEVERERLLVAEALATERQALIKRIVHAQEEERRRLSHEVHDSITQLAHAAALRLDAITERLASSLSAEDHEEVVRARDLTRTVTREARRLIRGLRPEAIDQVGLATALRAEVLAMRAEGYKASFRDGNMEGVRLSDEVEITLYRVAQEALTNVRKHAGPASIHVELRRRTSGIRLSIRDSGHGFDLTAGRGDASQQVGLVGMRERVELIGGSFHLQSTPGDGTRIEVSLPIPRLPPAS